MLCICCCQSQDPWKFIQIENRNLRSKKITHLLIALYGCSRSFSLKRSSSIKKKVADINIKEGGGAGGGGGGGAGGRYAYEMLKNAKNQKCTASPAVGKLQPVNNEQPQWAIDASDVALRSSGEWTKERKRIVIKTTRTLLKQNTTENVINVIYILECDRLTLKGDSESSIKKITLTNVNDVNAMACGDSKNGNKINANIIYTNPDNSSVKTSEDELKSNSHQHDSDEMIANTHANDKTAIVSSRTAAAAPTPTSTPPTSITKIKPNDNKKHIYMVAEGYHKTDSCYYKTPDGGYHKLPPDSYHKMSEICYNKLPDGSFKRLVDIKNVGSGEMAMNGSTDGTNAGTQSKVRNQMIKFLKRSKSHSQATAKDTYINYRKEMQRTKEKEKDLSRDSNSANVGQQKTPISPSSGQGSAGNKSTASHSYGHTNQRHSSYTGNRKVVVTMMENGGLPIVATSKTKSPKNEYKTHHQNVIRDKVKEKTNTKIKDKQTNKCSSHSYPHCFVFILYQHTN